MEKEKELGGFGTGFFYNIKGFVFCQFLLMTAQWTHAAYIRSCISTFERRYGMTSSAIGFILSLEELTQIILGVFVSYFGCRVHRPRFVGAGGLIMSAAAACLYLLHVSSEPLIPAQDGSDLRALCVGRENVSALVACHEGSHSSSQAASESQAAVLILTLSQVLFGVGTVPIQPFSVSYLDDFTSPKDSALYVGILQATIPLGFSFGSILSAITLQTYVDVDKVDMDSVKLTPSDLDWVGAWWIGVLFTSCFLALTSIPMFFFCHSKRPAINDAPSDDPANQSMVNFLKSFPGILLNMLCSWSFALLTLANCTMYLSVHGFTNFLMKFLEVQYNARASYVNLLTGLTYPISSIGLLVGGLFIKYSKTPFRNLPWACFGALCLAAVFLVPQFFLGCTSQSPPAGVHGDNTMTSLSTCWANCSCSESAYAPVCGEDGEEYISPCHAGCTNFTMNSQNETQLVYTQCSCVPSADGDKMGIARPGKCLQSICIGFLYVSLAFFTVTNFLQGFVNTVLYVMLIRVIPQESIALGVGLEMMIFDLLGSFPSPLLFGFIFDSSCAMWSRTCEGQRLTCRTYDKENLRYWFFGMHIGCFTLGSLLLIAGQRSVQKSHIELTTEEGESHQ